MDAELRRRFESILARIEAGPDRPSGGSLDRAEDELSTRARDRSLPAQLRLEAAGTWLDRHRGDRKSAGLVAELLGDPDRAVVLGAIELVAPWDQTAMSRLVELLDQPDPSIRFAAARALGRRKSALVMPRVVSWLRGNEAEARQVAIDVLGWLLNDGEVTRILGGLWDRPDLGVAERLRLAARLAAAGDDRVADWLLEIAESGRPEAREADRLLRVLLDRIDARMDANGENPGDLG